MECLRNSLRASAERLVAVHENRTFSLFHLCVKPPSEAGHVDVTSGLLKEVPPIFAPLPSILFLAVWCHSSPFVPPKLSCLHSKAIKLLSEPVMAIRPSRGSDESPSSDRSRGRSKCPICVHGGEQDMCL